MITKTTVTVIVVTLNRPKSVERCLDCLSNQTHSPDQVIVVDASPGRETREVVERHPDVLYLRNENGWGQMTASRNIGLLESTGEIIAFVDDDAYAADHWLEALLAAYEDPTVAAVGGQVLSPNPNARPEPIEKIGLFTKDGMIAGCFSADPGKIIEVDHIMGCNMSYRRSVLAELGGLREEYTGISGVREDTDICLRLKALNKKIVFQPRASVVHEGASQAVGRRFDFRYDRYCRRNQVYMLMRNFGPKPIVWRYLVKSTIREIRHAGWRRPIQVIPRFLNSAVGKTWGFFRGLMMWMKFGTEPRRIQEGQAIKAYLLKGPVDQKLKAEASSVTLNV